MSSRPRWFRALEASFSSGRSRRSHPCSISPAFVSSSVRMRYRRRHTNSTIPRRCFCWSAHAVYSSHAASPSPDVLQGLREVELVMLDVDGVLTPGQKLYSHSGLIGLEFDARDGLGIALIRAAGCK